MGVFDCSIIVKLYKFVSFRGTFSSDDIYQCCDRNSLLSMITVLSVCSVDSLFFFEPHKEQFHDALDVYTQVIGFGCFADSDLACSGSL